MSIFFSILAVAAAADAAVEYFQNKSKFLKDKISTARVFLSGTICVLLIVAAISVMVA
jgi:hypothetical protein